MNQDYVVRAVAADSQIRAFACTTRSVVERARQIHDTSPVVTAALGRLLSAGCMMGCMMKGEQDLLTLQIKGDGPVGGITVTADVQGRVKGYVNEPAVILPANSKGKLDVAGAVGKGTLRVIRDMGLKEPYVGSTALQTGEIAEDLTYYFAASEQIPSCVGLGVLMEKDNTVRQAGGFILQMMPFAEEGLIDRLEANLSGIDSVTAMLDEGRTPEQILQKLLGGLEMETMDTIPAEYFCGCCSERVQRAIIGIGKKDIREMIDEGKEIEVKCQFCDRKYVFSVGDLEKMYRQALR